MAKSRAKSLYERLEDMLESLKKLEIETGKICEVRMFTDQNGDLYLYDSEGNCEYLTSFVDLEELGVWISERG
jgi:hypothetical protein